MSVEWTTYACDPLPPNSRDTHQLTSVYHVTHAHTALRIIEDGKIGRGLVHDHSKLNITRRTVVWVSPNTWHYGSRYGTVQFEFDWNALIAGKSIYWVEAMNQYRPTAIRFFITGGNISGLPSLAPYDPTSAAGPLRLLAGQWWWNSKYTLELMIDDDLALSACTGVQFVQHHPELCNIGRSHCTELGKSGHHSSARVMAYVLNTERNTADHTFVENGRLTFSAEGAFSTIGMRLGAMSNTLGGPIRNRKSAKEVVRGALAQLALGRPKEGKALVGLLSSDRLFWEILQDICQEHFGLASPMIQEGIGA